MSIDIRELERLWNKAIVSCGDDFGQKATCDEMLMAAYLMAHIPEILAALRDKERLDKLNDEDVDTIYLDDGRILDVGGKSAGNLRAAIDALGEE